MSRRDHDASAKSELAELLNVVYQKACNGDFIDLKRLQSQDPATVASLLLMLHTNRREQFNAAIHADLLPGILPVLASTSHDCAARAAACIKLFAEVDAQAVVDAGALPVLVSSIKHVSSSVKEQAALALHSLANSVTPKQPSHELQHELQQALQPLIDAGAVTPLCRLLQEDRLQVRQAAGRALGFLSRHPQVHQSIPHTIKKFGLLPAVVELVSSTSSDISNPALHLLHSLQPSNYQHISSKDRGAIIRILQTAMVDEHMVHHMAVRCMCNLAEADQESRKILAAGTAIGHLCTRLNSEDASVRQCAAQTLAYLAPHGVAELLREERIEALLKLVRDETARLTKIQQQEEQQQKEQQAEQQEGRQEGQQEAGAGGAELGGSSSSDAEAAKSVSIVTISQALQALDAASSRQEGARKLASCQPAGTLLAALETKYIPVAFRVCIAITRLARFKKTSRAALDIARRAASSLAAMLPEPVGEAAAAAAWGLKILAEQTDPRELSAVATSAITAAGSLQVLVQQVQQRAADILTATAAAAAAAQDAGADIEQLCQAVRMETPALELLVQWSLQELGPDSSSNLPGAVQAAARANLPGALLPLMCGPRLLTSRSAAGILLYMARHPELREQLQQAGAAATLAVLLQRAYAGAIRGIRGIRGISSDKRARHRHHVLPGAAKCC